MAAGTHPAPPDPDSPAQVRLRRLRWRARRGLLENDLVLGRYFARHGAAIDDAAAAALADLLDLPDGELLDLVLSRAELQGPLARAEVREVLGHLRAA